MLSKGLLALRATRSLQQNATKSFQQVRNSHAAWNYRSAGAPPSKFLLTAAEGVQGFAWWWVLWHLYTEPGHVFGEFPYPDPRKWTDEELGVPPIE